MVWYVFSKQKTAYEVRISDWSSDVCSSDLPDCRAVLEPLDHQGLLATVPAVAASADATIGIDDLAAELAGVAEADDITVLRHVRTSADKRAAEEIADRKPCEDFAAFKPLFERVQTQVKTDRKSGAWGKRGSVRL